MSSHPIEAEHAALRVAIIGYGLAGAVFHAPLIATTPGMKVAAIVTGSRERQRQVRSDFPQARVIDTADELWRNAGEYDLVVIAAPNRAHVPLGIAAMRSGLPVVIDKPVAASSADAEQLLAASQETGKLLTVFQNRRWDNDFLTVQKILAAGMLGPITRFESRFERYRPAPKLDAWRELAAPQEAGGLLFDLGSHLIDQAMQLFGRPVSVYAEMARRRPGVEVDDDTFVALHFANGVDAHMWMSVVSRLAGPRMRVLGLRGAFEKWGLDPQEDALREGMRPGDPHWGLEPREKWGKLSTDIDGIHIEGPVETLPGAYEQFYALLRDALQAGGPPPVDAASALVALRVIEAARHSANERRIVELP